MKRRVEQVRQACAGLDDVTAGRTPPGEDRWSVKQVISHLCGPETTGHTAELRRFLAEDTPLLDIEAGNHFHTPEREQKSINELLSDFEAEFARVASFVRPLSDDQLSRKARIPMLKDSPLGEYPTLGQWVGALAEFHVGFHVEQLGKIRSEVG
ncbi:MAG: DinB family protein [Deltaproteobacteria bacterium]|nr:DinB family protein [Deltaproteobacteria bacterium]